MYDFFFFFPFVVLEIGKEKKGGGFEETLMQCYSDCGGHGEGPQRPSEVEKFADSLNFAKRFLA